VWELRKLRYVKALITLLNIGGVEREKGNERRGGETIRTA